MKSKPIVLPGKVIIIKVQDKDHGFFARINTIVRDPYAKNRVCWLVNFTPLIPFKDWKIIDIQWKLNDEHIYGEEFTMDGIYHQLFKVDFPLEDVEEEPEVAPAKAKRRIVHGLKLVEKK